MILEFSCSNHKSIANKVIFSALAGTDDSMMENVYSTNGLKVLNSAVIYGANGSGKSTLISALDYMRELVIDSIKNQPGDGIMQQFNKLKGYSVPSEYILQFLIDDVRYAYGFSIKDAMVEEEFLYYFPNGRKALVFSRENLDYKIGSKFPKSQFAVCDDVLKENRLFLSCAANFCRVEEINKVYRYFKDQIVLHSSENSNQWIDYSLNAVETDESIKRSVIEFMNSVGVPILDIEITHVNVGLPDADKLPEIFTDDFKTELLSQLSVMPKVSFVYKGFSTDFFREESTGVKKLFGMLCPLFDIIKNNKVLICDEIETSLHESIVRYLLSFCRKKSAENGAQIFFTTHDTSLLTPELFRRDQIWFTEMNQMRETDLYSLAEIKEVRKMDNFRNGYISGKYGAIPMLNNSFSNVFMEE